MISETQPQLSVTCNKVFEKLTAPEAVTYHNNDDIMILKLDILVISHDH